MTRRGESKRNPVLLSTCAPLSVNSAKHLEAHADRPFAAAQSLPWTQWMGWHGEAASVDAYWL